MVKFGAGCSGSCSNPRMPTLAVALLQALKDHGAREIFGIPGDFVLPFFKVIEESAHPAALHAQP